MTTDTGIFTPNLLDGDYPGEMMEDGRAVMKLSPEDRARTQSEAYDGDTGVTITDLNTDTRWLVRRTDCGLGCRCAAEAVPADVGHFVEPFTLDEYSGVADGLRNALYRTRHDGRLRRVYQIVGLVEDERGYMAEA